MKIVTMAIGMGLLTGLATVTLTVMQQDTPVLQQDGEVVSLVRELATGQRLILNQQEVLLGNITKLVEDQHALLDGELTKTQAVNRDNARARSFFEKNLGIDGGGR
jgi:hypothetical protein